MKPGILFIGAMALSFQTMAQQNITAVVNSASFQAGLPTGGSLATAFLSGVTGVQPGTYVAPSNLPLPNILAKVQVIVNDAYAPILAVVVTSSGGANYAQINFQVPTERNSSLKPSNSGVYSGSFAVCINECSVITPPPLQPSGAFFADSNGYAIAQHPSDYSLVTPQNPALPGETVIVYANDFYPVWPPTVIGIPTPLHPLYQKVSGLFGSGYFYLQATVPPPPLGPFVFEPSTPPLVTPFRGLAPGMVGVEQINFVVPATQPEGTFFLFLNSGCYNGVTQPDGCSPLPSSSPAVKLPVGKKSGA